MPRLRGLVVQPARDAVEKAIERLIGKGSKEFKHHILGDNAARVILAASAAARIPVPDNVLSSLHTAQDVVNFLCKPVALSGAHGVPLIELFGGAELPANVTLINYRKPKWSNDEHHRFILRALASAGITANYMSK